MERRELRPSQLVAETARTAVREERDAAVDEAERLRDGRIPLFGVGKANDFAFAEVVAAAVTAELR